MRNDDAISMAAEFHKVIFENDTVRVLRVSMPTGAKAAMHWHPKNFFYPLNDGHMKIEKPDGTQLEIFLKAGEGKENIEGSHLVENNGTGDIDGLQIELKT